MTEMLESVKRDVLHQSINEKRRDGPAGVAVLLEINFCLTVCQMRKTPDGMDRLHADHPLLKRKRIGKGFNGIADRAGVYIQ